MLNSKHHYTKIGREVNTQFSLFPQKEQENRRAPPDGRFLFQPLQRRAGGHLLGFLFCCALAAPDDRAVEQGLKR